MQTQLEATQVHDGRDDFDFYMGSWRVTSRRLRERLANCTEWEEFEGECTARKILNGLGNMDEVTFHRESGTFHGMTVRLFNAATQEWSIYWAASNVAIMGDPMIGSFKNGVGTFYDHEPHNGKHIFSRFLWTVISEDECRWEQAFSEDGGQTWETNWTMHNNRLK